MIDDSEFRKLSKKLLKNVAESQRVFREIAGDLHDESMTNFETESVTENSTRKKWRALTPERLKQRERMNKSGKILQVTGDLKRSVTPESGKNYAVAGSNWPYARDHQDGVPKRKLPARPFLSISKKLLDQSKQKIIKAVLGGLNGR